MPSPRRRGAGRGGGRGGMSAREPTVRDANRQGLHELQARLVRALTGQGEAPEGFDAGRLAVAARSLVNKRLRESARAWPALGRCLGGRYAERFRAYARV